MQLTSEERRKAGLMLFQVDSVRVELNCRSASWDWRIAWWCGKKTHTLELVSELEELNLDYQDGSNIITRVLKSRRGTQENSESEGDVT